MKVIEKIINIVAVIITALYPIYGFKRENQILKKKTKQGELVDLYQIILIIPIINFIILLASSNEVGFFKIILIIFSIILPVEAIILLTHKIWKLYIKNYPKGKLSRLDNIKNLGDFVKNIAIWLFYSLLLIYMLYLSYMGIIKDFEHLQIYIDSYITSFVLLVIMYFIIDKIAIGKYKEEYATKVKINYNYRGEDIEKEINYTNFTIKSEYVSFYMDNKDIRYIIPWDKVNDISIFYK